MINPSEQYLTHDNPELFGKAMLIDFDILGSRDKINTDTSDAKFIDSYFDEVLGNEVYLKKSMTIQAGETWMDCGGNVGAFTLLACSKGAKVTVYEPDPFNCEMIKKNLELKFSQEQ
jgi:hypothetical protein